MSPRKARGVRGGCSAIVLGGDKPPRGSVAWVWFVLCLWICLVTHTGLGKVWFGMNSPVSFLPWEFLLLWGGEALQLVVAGWDSPVLPLGLGARQEPVQFWGGKCGFWNVRHSCSSRWSGGEGTTKGKEFTELRGCFWLKSVPRVDNSALPFCG